MNNINNALVRLAMLLLLLPCPSSAEEAGSPLRGIIGKTDGPASTAGSASATGSTETSGDGQKIRPEEVYPGNAGSRRPVDLPYGAGFETRARLGGMVGGGGMGRNMGRSR